MTFAEIVDRVAKRLNLTSPQALERISEGVNDRYRQLVSSIGLQTSVRGTVTADTTASNRLLTFEDVEKLYVVYDDNFSPTVQLAEISADEMRNMTLLTEPARSYAIWSQDADSVTIQLDSVPSGVYTYTADAEQIVATMSGVSIPAFPSKFHDILVFGGIAEELYKMEKYQMGDRYEARYQERVSELRLQLAMSAYRTVYQSKTDHVRRIV